MLNALIVTSVFIIISIIATAITENAKFMGIGLALFIITVFWNLKLLFICNNVTTGDLLEHIKKSEIEAKEKKRYFERGVYFIVVPILGVCIIMMILILIAFFTVL